MCRKRLVAAMLSCVTLSVAGLGAAPSLGQTTTFGYGNARENASPGPVGISPAQVHNLHVAWQARVGGAVTGQPLAVGGIRARGRRRTLLVVGTETGQVVALDASSGQVMWRRQLGRQRITPDCQASPHSIFGITGTLAIDPAARRVYAVDVTGRAWALDLRTGRPAPGWPVRVHPSGGFVWGALTLSRGRLYVPVASLCDVGHVFGGIVAVSVARPQHLITWYTTANTGSWGGGIWGWGGVAVDDTTGDIFAATGNSQGAIDERVGYGEAVVRLSPRLTVEQSNQPLAPSIVGDVDFGTTPALIHARGCPRQLVAINKDGELFLYDRAAISAGPRQRLRVASAGQAFIPLYGVPAYDETTRTLVLTTATLPSSTATNPRLLAFALTAGCRLVPRWTRLFDVPGAGAAPMIAQGAIYIGGGRDGWFRVYRLSDGRLLWSQWLSAGGVIAAALVTHGSVYIADWGGTVTAYRLG